MIGGGCPYAEPEWYCVLPRDHEGDHMSTWLGSGSPDDDYVARLEAAQSGAATDDRG